MGDESMYPGTPHSLRCVECDVHLGNVRVEDYENADISLREDGCISIKSWEMNAVLSIRCDDCEKRVP